jgi:hypothetical protein
MKIKLRITMRAGMNGELARKGTPYSDYEILLVDELPTYSETVLNTIVGYDRFMSHVYDIDQIRQDAVTYLNEKAKFMHIQIAEPEIIITDAAKKLMLD